VVTATSPTIDKLAFGVEETSTRPITDKFHDQELKVEGIVETIQDFCRVHIINIDQSDRCRRQFQHHSQTKATPGPVTQRINQRRSQGDGRGAGTQSGMRDFDMPFACGILWSQTYDF
jgi:hypothetical protein